MSQSLSESVTSHLLSCFGQLKIQLAPPHPPIILFFLNFSLISGCASGSQAKNVRTGQSRWQHGWDPEQFPMRLWLGRRRRKGQRSLNWRTGSDLPSNFLYLMSCGRRGYSFLLFHSEKLCSPADWVHKSCSLLFVSWGHQTKPHLVLGTCTNYQTSPRI